MAERRGPAPPNTRGGPSGSRGGASRVSSGNAAWNGTGRYARPPGGSSRKPGGSARGGRRRRKRSPVARPFWIVMAVMAVIVLTLWLRDAGLPLMNDQRMPLPKENEIRVVFIDVGQGDAILIHDPRHAVLIDAGESTESDAVLSCLRAAGVTALDLAVATHPHSDHIGGMAAVLKEVPARRMWMPNAVSGTAAFERLLDQLEAAGTPVETPGLGEVFAAGPIELTALAPAGTPAEWTDEDDLNNASLVLRMVYGDTGFLFTGDAEASSERAMLDGGRNLRVSILKVGHHGSDTSTTDAWLDAVNPGAAVISCGAGNSYGHPHAETLGRLNARGIQTYRTDESGTVAMVTDGKDVYVYAGKTP